jgi:DNA polymerase-3 subunit chi
VTRIDFYILPESSAGDGTDSGAVIAACKLCDKAASAGMMIYVHTGNSARATDIDGALWSFRQNSFIAHEQYTGQALEAPLPPVLIGAQEPPDTHHGVLINLDADIPAFFSRFDRVLEIVGGNAEQRKASRERFKFYRDRGYELNTFEQTDTGGWSQRAK